MVYLDESRVLLKYILPLSEVVLDFYDAIKSESSGYARYLIFGLELRNWHLNFVSFDYEDHGFEPVPLVKVINQILHVFVCYGHVPVANCVG